MQKDVIRYSIIFSLLIGFIGCGDYCENTIKPIKIEGKVVDKYIAEHNHATKTIIYNENNTDYLIVLYDSELWDYISVGDSILKDNNSLIVNMKRDNNTIEFEYPCPH